MKFPFWSPVSIDERGFFYRGNLPFIDDTSKEVSLPYKKPLFTTINFFERILVASLESRIFPNYTTLNGGASPA